MLQASSKDDENKCLVSDVITSGNPVSMKRPLIQEVEVNSGNLNARETHSLAENIESKTKFEAKGRLNARDVIWELAASIGSTVDCNSPELDHLKKDVDELE